MIADNSGLYYRGTAIRSFFFVPDGIYLSKEGLNLFVTNMKFYMRKSLNLETQRARPPQNLETQRSRPPQSGSRYVQSEQNYQRNSFIPILI